MSLQEAKFRFTHKTYALRPEHSWRIAHDLAKVDLDLRTTLSHPYALCNGGYDGQYRYSGYAEQCQGRLAHAALAF